MEDLSKGPVRPEKATEMRVDGRTMKWLTVPGGQMNLRRGRRGIKWVAARNKIWRGLRNQMGGGIKLGVWRGIKFGVARGIELLS
jgi:hypothetical protein